MKILGICGSLRHGSYNHQLLVNAAKLLSNQAEMTIRGCGDLPFYNKDLDTENKPEPVVSFIDAIRQADGLVFATPEYNYSFPGVLKNAIDWASRPAYKSVLAGKPVAILSASQSLVGGARAQGHLRQVLIATLSLVAPAPQFLLPMAQQKFDALGNLSDPTSQDQLRRYMTDFVVWVNRLTGQ